LRTYLKLKQTEAARHLGIDRNTVHRWIESDKLKPVKSGSKSLKVKVPVIPEENPFIGRKNAKWLGYGFVVKEIDELIDTVKKTVSRQNLLVACSAQMMRLEPSEEFRNPQNVIRHIEKYKITRGRPNYKDKIENSFAVFKESKEVLMSLFQNHDKELCLFILRGIADENGVELNEARLHELLNILITKSIHYLPFLINYYSIDKSDLLTQTPTIPDDSFVIPEIKNFTPKKRIRAWILFEFYCRRIKNRSLTAISLIVADQVWKIFKQDKKASIKAAYEICYRLVPGIYAKKNALDDTDLETIKQICNTIASIVFSALQNYFKNTPKYKKQVLLEVTPEEYERMIRHLGPELISYGRSPVKKRTEVKKSYDKDKTPQDESGAVRVVDADFQFFDGEDQEGAGQEIYNVDSAPVANTE
jgi:helix-turn-helix protein